jgi:hypothetical protein
MKRIFTGVVIGVMMGGLAIAEMTNSLDREYWTNQKDGVSTLVQKEVAPTDQDQLKSFESVSWNNSKKKAYVADQYSQRVRGYLVPKVSGDYVFWIAADDNGVLFLSSDANPANKEQIANAPGWTNLHQWDKFPSQKSKLVKLTAGEVYYVEAHHHEAVGGDCLAVGWSKPGEARDKPSEVVPGAVLSALSAGVPTK